MADDQLSVSDHSIRYEPSDEDDESFLGMVENGFYSNDSMIQHHNYHHNNGNNIQNLENDPSTRTTPEIAKSETRAVFYLKITVKLVLILAAVFISALTFFVVRREEREDFNTQFVDFSSKIIDSFYRSTNMKLWTANTLSTAYTSYMVNTHTVWPMVTQPDFKIRLAGARQLALASTITFSPYLPTDTSRLEWEQYAKDYVEQQGQYHSPPHADQQEDEQVGEILHNNSADETTAGGSQLINRNNNDSNNNASQNITRPLHHQEEQWGVQNGIYYFDKEAGEQKSVPFGSPPYVPIWQISPENINQGSIMFDQLSKTERRSALDGFFEEHSGGNRFSKTIFDASSMHPPHVRSHEPRGILYYPVVENFLSRQISGVIGIEYLWSAYFEEFPSQFNGLVVVLENTCGQRFTFEVQNGTIKFVGPDDLHDDHFDSVVQRSTYEEFHALCHYGKDFWMSAFQNGRRRRSRNLATEGQEENQGESETPGHLFTGDIIDSNSSAHENTVGSEHGAEKLENHTCHYAIRVYPSKGFEERYITNEPQTYAISVAMIFVFAFSVFFVYDCIVERRQSLTLKTAVRSIAVVDSLFPIQVRDRIFKSAEQEQEKNRNRRTRRHAKGRNKDAWRNTSVDDNNNRRRLIEPPRLKLKSYLMTDTAMSSINESEIVEEDTPIADLFPATTIMFGDISGFTAWASEREPKDVFTLLETLYQAFDNIAKKLGVFKVETIGDCYVAVTGLPEPNEDHAIIMSRFSYECLCAMNELTKKLDAVLGPGTADLALRVGMHSGPVTAGVLRGDKSRFQLFGDTMNTASRMESNSKRNMIQVSGATADILVASGKQHWLTPREELVTAKGKGDMQTYWLRPTRRNSSSVSSDYKSRKSSMEHGSMANLYSVRPGEKSSDSSINFPVSLSFSDTSDRRMTKGFSQNKKNPWGTLTLDNEGLIETTNSSSTNKRAERLIDWCSDVLAALLEKISAHHKELEATGLIRRRQRRSLGSSSSMNSFEELHCNPIDEVTEIISIPAFDAKKAANHRTRGLTEEARAELRDYVSAIASLYHDVPFHNIEHAAHVTMSANKLVNRIILPDDVDYGENFEEVASQQHRSTYGISSDPLSQFAIVLAALIHDVDHTGLPNSRLVKEKTELSSKYNEKSVAEQNSVDVAWSLLMERRFTRLRGCIYATEKERRRFRQLIINAVMATDIMDKDMLALRKNRWDKAFDVESTSGSVVSRDSGDPDDLNCKATIVIDHIIQASDVAHTMQHWHIYCKWNERLFQEQYKAYLSGHMDRNPAVGWYEGEIWFFDNYIIPLANKLRECGVFGVSSDEYLGFALGNRTEWELKGHTICEEMTFRAQQKFGFPTPVINIKTPKAG